MPLLSFRLHFAKILRATSCTIAAHVHQLQGEGHGRTSSLFRFARKPSILFQGRTLNHSRVCSGFVSLCGRNIFESGAPTERQVSAFLCRRLTNSFYQGKGQGTEGVRRNNQFRSRNKTTAIYVVAIGVTVLGLSYAAVPLYRLYCQATGLGGTVKTGDTGEKIEKMERKPERVLKIRFNADTSSTMQWKFRPQQSEVRLAPGETALAFYTATNPTDKPVTGISTYNVIPFDAGQYFNKIQCFCFEEQRLNPHEQVDMPVFFYIDPEFTEDPAMARVDTITLSYTFFEAKEAEQLGL